MKLLERRRNLIGAFARFIRFISGKPPLTLEACVNDKSTIDYKVYGESVQDGTPTPDAPIEVESVGEKTINLFDFDSISGLKTTNGSNLPYSYSIENGIITNKYGRYGSGTYFVCNITRLEAGTYTLSCNVKNSTQSHIYLQLKTPDNYIGSIRPIILNQWNRISSIITFAEDTDILGISIQGVGDSSNYTKLDIQICDIQLELNSVASPYEPYGKYKIPVVASGKNLFDIENPVYAALSQNNLNRKPKIENGIVYFNTYYANAGGAGFVVPMPPNTTFTISWENVSGSHWYEILGFEYAENGIIQNWYRFIPQEKDATSVTYTQLSDKKYILILLDCVGGYYKAGIKNLQVTTGADVKPYEPYQEPITTHIYLDEPLRKIGDYADYIDFENQVVVRNIKRVDLKNAPGGTYSWLGKKGVTFDSLLDKNYSRNQNAFCNREYHFTAGGAEKSTIWVGAGSNIIYWVGILDALELASTEEFNEWLTSNPTYLLYGSDLPIETPIELPQLPTFKGTTIYSIDTNIQPSNMEVTYYSKERSVS